jgi:D-tyrosyl-tRNA(Tyr) deacylase
MRALIQRVLKSSVKIKGTTISSINAGLNVLLAVKNEDSAEDAEYLADKIAKMRIFNDSNDKMNMSIQDVNGSVIVISQFTLYGDCRKGNRPSFTESADAEKADMLYEYFIKYLMDNYKIPVQTGVFAANMEVEIINDGPVTIILDSQIRRNSR